jgi:hypothetical protein
VFQKKVRLYLQRNLFSYKFLWIGIQGYRRKNKDIEGFYRIQGYRRKNKRTEHQQRNMVG